MLLTVIARRRPTTETQALSQLRGILLAGTDLDSSYEVCLLTHSFPALGLSRDRSSGRRVSWRWEGALCSPSGGRP